ncbi:hypothetical protein [Spirillospora sp. NPDC047279]|uniref:hypothetical protein n=1 Tax=Spirillospora sp. NPDC047279 TaxID=3155478 RepID=UPI0033EC6A54
MWVAAIGLLLNAAALGFQGWQTRSANDQAKSANDQARTANDQARLANIQEARSRDELAKRQARLVNIWPEAPFTGERARVVVSNRAENPLANFRVFTAFDKTVSVDYAIQRWIALPPCTELTVDLFEIIRSFPATARALKDNRPRHRLDYGLMFNDVNGQAWTRHPSTTVVYNTWLEYLDGPDRDRTPNEPKYLRDAGHVPLAGAPMTLAPGGGRFIVGKPRAARSCVSDPQ